MRKRHASQYANFGSLRVIGQNGQLTGYAGGLSAKQYLLELEQRNKNIFSLFPSVHKVSE